MGAPSWSAALDVAGRVVGSGFAVYTPLMEQGRRDWLSGFSRIIVSQSEPMHDSLAALSQFFVGDRTLGDTLQRVVDLSEIALPNVDMVGITMLVDGKASTAVFSNPAAPEIDVTQYQGPGGPCLEAYHNGEIIGIPVLEDDGRWPDFAAAAGSYGVKSTLSIPLRVGDDSVGALNFYSKVDHGFGDDALTTATAFATQAAIVLANAQAYWDARTLSEGLSEAMRSRATIEQAKGVVMAQSDVDADTAFELLKRASQRENRKLRDIAGEFVGRRRREPL